MNPVVLQVESYSDLECERFSLFLALEEDSKGRGKQLCPAAEVWIFSCPFYISPKVGFIASIFKLKSFDE